MMSCCTTTLVWLAIVEVLNALRIRIRSVQWPAGASSMVAVAGADEIGAFCGTAEIFAAFVAAEIGAVCGAAEI